MAEFTHKELRTARESRKMARWKLAGEIGVSEDTLKRWEDGAQLPSPDDVGHIERILGIPGLWHRWMMSTYDSYRERNLLAPERDHPAADLMQLKYEMLDVMALFEEAERDVIDGRIDSPVLWEKLKKEVQELIAAAQQVIAKFSLLMERQR